MSVVIKLNNVDITDLVDKKSFLITEKINYKVDSLSFDFLKTENKNTIPEDEDSIEVSIDGTLIFKGIIDNIQVKIVGKKTPIFHVEASDLTKLLTKKLLAKVYENKTVYEIVTDIINNELTGLGLTAGVIDNIDKNLGKVVFDYKKVSDVFSDLADYSLAYWKVTPDGKIHFRQRGSETAPLLLQDGNDSYLENSISITKSTRQKRNVIYVIGADYVGELTTDVVGEGNGTQKTFRLPYVYDEKPTVKVNGVSQTVGVAYLDTSGYQCYWDRNGKNIIFENAPANSYDVEVTGKPLIPLMTRLNAGGSKKYEHKIIDKTLTSKEAVKERAKAELDAYAKEITSGSFETYTIGTRAGQKVTINSSLLGVTDEFIATEVKTFFHGEKLKNYIKIASKGEYDIIDLFRYLLRKGEKEFGLFRDTSTILLDYIGIVEKLIAHEEYTIRFYDIKANENLEITEDILFRDNFAHIWVVGDYSPTSINDTKRVPIISKGALIG